jgi:hypothetical protein
MEIVTISSDICVQIRTPNTYITLKEYKKFNFQGWRNYGKIIRIG